MVICEQSRPCSLFCLDARGFGVETWLEDRPSLLNSSAARYLQRVRISEWQEETLPKTVALCSHLLSTQLQTTPSPLFRLLPPPVTLNRPELPLAPGSLQIPSTPLQSNQSPAPSTLSTKSHSHCLQPWNERAGTIASPQIGRYLTYLTSAHWPPRSNKAIKRKSSKSS